MQTIENCMAACIVCEKKVKLERAVYKKTNRSNFIIGFCPTCGKKCSVLNGMIKGYRSDRRNPPTHRKLKNKIVALERLTNKLNFLLLEFKELDKNCKVIKRQNRRPMPFKQTSVDGLVNQIVAETKNPTEPSKPSAPESLKEKEWYKKYVKGESNEQQKDN